MFSKWFGKQWKGAVAVGNRDVLDSDKELSLKIRLYIRLFFL